MKTSISIVLALLLTLSFQCNAQKIAEATDFDWLKGSWELKTSKGIVYESWSRLNASTLKGISYKLSGSDTIVLETVHLSLFSSGWVYIPLVTGQNDGKTVTFRITYVDKEAFVAENPDHDFPKKITYARTGTHLDATISGDGKEIRYPFTIRQ
jgi:hypothetical protein